MLKTKNNNWLQSHCAVIKVQEKLYLVVLSSFLVKRGELVGDSVYFDRFL